MGIYDGSMFSIARLLLHPCIQEREGAGRLLVGDKRHGEQFC